MSSKIGARFVFLTALCLAGAFAMFLRHSQRRQIIIPVPEIARRELVQIDGRRFQAGHTNPFTGIMVDRSPDGSPLLRCEISNGLLNGVCEGWYTNGQMQVREHFKNGVSHGLREKWHENGARLSQASIVEGKVTGTFQSWHDNGQLAERIEMKLGKAEGTAWAYYPSGFLKAETTVHEGDVLDRKVWKDGERRQSD
jgi:antitoxin component YwqK of YwqJK toxin-antitoxin module